MAYFPSYSGLQIRKGPSTRQSLGIENITTMEDYTNDTDPDDLASIYVNNLNNGQSNGLPLDYKTIVMTLLLNYYKNLEQFSGLWDTIDQELEEIINEILENIPEDKRITPDKILKEIIINSMEFELLL